MPIISAQTIDRQANRKNTKFSKIILEMRTNKKIFLCPETVAMNFKSSIFRNVPKPYRLYNRQPIRKIIPEKSKKPPDFSINKLSPFAMLKMFNRSVLSIFDIKPFVILELWKRIQIVL